MASIASSETFRQRTESVNAAIKQARRSKLGQFATAWGELRAGEGAILIAWQLLFSLFPLVVGMLSILGLVLRNPDRQAAIAQAIGKQFPSQASDLVSFISETRDLGGIFGIFSVVGLLWSGSTLFGTMATVFDRFYGAPDRSFVQTRLVSFAMMVVYAVLISVSVGSSSVTGLLVGLSQDILPFQLPFFAFAIGWLVSVASAILMFLVLYRFVPNGQQRFWHVWRGSVLAGVLFVLLTQIFPIYLTYLGGGFAAYKALGVFLLLMTWFYFMSMILCAGALLNAVLSGHVPLSAREAKKAQADTAKREAAQRKGEASGGTVKVLIWTGLTASVTSLTLIVARQAAGQVWRVLTRQEPPA